MNEADTIERLYMACVIRKADARVLQLQNSLPSMRRPSWWLKKRKYYMKHYRAETVIRGPKPLRYRRTRYMDPFETCLIHKLQIGCRIHVKPFKTYVTLKKKELAYKKPEWYFKLTFDNGASLTLRGRARVAISKRPRNLADEEIMHKNFMRTLAHRKKRVQAEVDIQAYKQAFADEQIEYLLENNLEWDDNDVLSYYDCGVREDFDIWIKCRHEPVPQHWDITFGRYLRDWNGIDMHRAKVSGDPELIRIATEERAVKLKQNKIDRAAFRLRMNNRGKKDTEIV